MRPDIEELVERARFECKFRPLLLISNGTLLDRKPLILHSVTGLVVSLEDFRVRVLEIKLKVFGHERRFPHQPAQELPLRRRIFVCALIRKNHSYRAMPLLCSRIDAHNISAQTHGL